MTCTWASGILPCPHPATHAHYDERGVRRAFLCEVHDLALRFAEKKGGSTYAVAWASACGLKLTPAGHDGAYSTVTKEPTGEDL